MTTPSPDAPAHRREFDGRFGDVIVEVSTGAHGFRNLHAKVMQLATYLAEHPGQRGILLVVNPRISTARLRDDVTNGTHVLRDDLRARLAVAIAHGDSVEGIPADLGQEFREWLDDVIRHEVGSATIRLKRADGYAVVLELLVNRWLENAGPVPTNWLMSASGLSYPTVASALRRLAAVIRRATDRRVELARFPRDEWAQTLAGAANLRSTVAFVDASGQPRSPHALFERLKQLGRADVGVGGVIGAQHYVPQLDLVGAPRLDLSVHCPENALDLSFVAQLDPALQPQPPDTRRPPSLVVHCVRRRESLFARGTDGVNWADAAQCLLDLHEARLFAQAEEFVQHFAVERLRAASKERA